MSRSKTIASKRRLLVVKFKSKIRTVVRLAILLIRLLQQEKLPRVPRFLERTVQYTVLVTSVRLVQMDISLKMVNASCQPKSLTVRFMTR